MERREKTKLKVVFVGHVDSGKSSLCGRLMMEGGGIDRRTLEKVEKEWEDMGRPFFTLASIPNESARLCGNANIFIDPFVFESNMFTFSFWDCPGMRDFSRGLIHEGTNAQVAILVVSATNGEFEAGICRDGQTRTHISLCKSLGIDNLIVVVNKMDTVDWDHDRFLEIKSELCKWLDRIGYNSDFIPIIPISTLGGEFVSRKVSHTKKGVPNRVKYYRGSGSNSSNSNNNNEEEEEEINEEDKVDLSWVTTPTLFQSLNDLSTPPDISTKPTRVVIEVIFDVQFQIRKGKVLLNFLIFFQ